MAAMMAGAMIPNPTHNIDSDITPEEIEKAKEKRNISKGLKKFIIDGETVWAINEKSAKKKCARKLKS